MWDWGGRCAEWGGCVCFFDQSLTVPLSPTGSDPFLKARHGALLFLATVTCACLGDLRPGPGPVKCPGRP